MRVTTYIPSQVEHDLQRLEPGDYTQGITAFLQAFRSLFRGRAAVYQFGEVGTPGVSDLDLLMVVQDDQWHEAEECARKASRCTEQLTYLFLHPPLIVGASLLDSLPYLHTLENLHLISDGWHPLANIESQEIDMASRLMRHAVWNSFIRISALEMDGKPIGMRRMLTLTHNLYLTALNSNRLLRDPLPIKIDSNEIRRHILEAPHEHREALAKEFLEEVLLALRRVDEHLSEELNVHTDFAEVKSWMFVHRHRFILPGQAEAKFNGTNSYCLLQNARLTFVPDYLLALVSLLIHRTTPGNHHLAFLYSLPFPMDLARRIPSTTYERHFIKALELSQQCRVSYPFVLPFSPRESAVSWRKKLIEKVHRRILEGMLRNGESTPQPKFLK